MIGKTKTGRGFRGLIGYVISKVEAGQGEILEVRGARDFDKRSMIRDFISRAKSNPQLTKCTWHTSLSFNDPLTNDQMLSISKQWAKGMGLDSTQYLIVAHTDKDHPHIHIVANRVNDEGRTISDSNNWRRSEALCKELVKVNRLTPVPENRNEDAINRASLRGRDLLKTDLNRLLGHLLPLCKDVTDFQVKISSMGYGCVIRYNPDNSIRGMTFSRDGIVIKASDVNRKYSAKGISSLIDENTALKMSKEKTVETPNQSSIRPIQVGKILLENEDDEETKKKKKNDQSMSM